MRTPEDCRLQVDCHEWHAELFLGDPRAKAEAVSYDHSLAWNPSLRDECVLRAHQPSDPFPKHQAPGPHGVPEIWVAGNFEHLFLCSHLHIVQPGTLDQTLEVVVASNRDAVTPCLKRLRQSHQRMHVACAAKRENENIHERFARCLRENA